MRKLAKAHLPSLDLHALRAFSVVCDAGSIVAAAKALGVTQSAVSQLVGSLERQCGVTLLDRDYRPVLPTAAGRVLREMAEDLLSHANAVAERIHDVTNGEHARIRFACVDSFAATLGPSLVLGLSGSTREIVMFSGITPVLLQQLHHRELDLAICTDIAAEQSKIERRVLFSETFVAVVPRSRRGSRKDLASLTADLPLIRYTRRSFIGQQVERYLLHAKLVRPWSYEFDATDPLLSLVAADLGWAITTPLCIWQSRHHISDIDVIPLPANRLCQRSFFLLHHQGEWKGLAAEMADLTRSTLQLRIMPQIMTAIPRLEPTSISFD